MDSPLKTATLNTNGLMDFRKRRSILRLLKKDNLDIVALQETHICIQKDIDDSKKLWGGHIHHCSDSNKSKGLITLLHPRFNDCKFVNIWSSDRVLISRLHLGDESLYIVNVYCPCKNGEKVSFMKDFQKEIEINLGVQNIPNTLFMGDFNIALSPTLDIVTGNPHPKVVCDAFDDFVQSLSLLDTWRSLHKDEKNFTFSKAGIARRLDYIFTGDSLGHSLNDSLIKSIGFSDHRMVVTVFEFSSFKRGKGMYKLNTSLLNDTEYIQLIPKVISNTTERYCALDPHSRWEMTKVNIRDVSKKFSESKSRKKRDRLDFLHKHLNLLEEAVASNPLDNDKWNQISKVKSELEILEIEKAKGAQIRSRIQYIEEGEKNTKFFLSLEKG